MDDLATATPLRAAQPRAELPNHFIFVEEVNMLDEKRPTFGSRAPWPLAKHTALAIWVVLAVAPISRALPPESPIRLSESVDPGDLSQVKALLEVEGQLQLKPGGATTPELPLKITGKFLYDERRLTSNEVEPNQGKLASVRHYHRAEALFELNNERRQSVLPEARRLIVVRRSGDQTTLGAPHGPLTREHTELIDIPGNSLLLAGLLPGDAVAVGQSWEVSNTALQGLLGWDSVTDCQVRGQLNSVKDDAATIDYEGTANGTANGVATTVELKAKSVFDLQRHRIRWFGAALRENRDVGPAEPGFKVTARLQMAIGQLDTSAPLSEASLAELSPTPGETPPPLLIESSNAGCRLLADSRWYLTVDRHDATVLRFVDDGESLAQCNITSMPDLAPGKHVLLETFQQDIRQTLANNFGQFIDASQWRTNEGLRVLRVSAEGAVSEVTVQWIYYLISDEKGRRTAVVFTLDQKNAERFAAADQALVSGFQFVEPPTAEQPRVSDKRTAGTTANQ
jgi:hypothetical protein